MPEALTIHELADRCEWALERTQRWFELMGAWSSVADGDLKRVVLARVATHAAAHVEWWAQRVPAVDGVARATSATDTEQNHWAVAITALAGEGPTALGLQGAAELLTRWIDEYARWIAVHDPDLDAPTVRVLELVLSDLTRDRDDLVAAAG